MTSDLLTTIGRQLNIAKSAENEQLCQIVYSVAGQMALASLWDRTEDNVSISIQHFKKRIAQIFDAYQSLFPKLEFLFPKDRTVLIDEIYSIYLRNGFFYHSSHQISPAAHTEAGFGSLLLHRGSSPDSKLCMSGLGFYSIQNPVTDNTPTNMFGLQHQSFDGYLDELLSHGEWENVIWPDNTEFLRLDPPFKWGYWQQAPSNDGRISLARYGEPNRIFAFYRYHEGLYQQKAIPEWRLHSYFSNDSDGHGEYRRIATALLLQHHTLPKINVKFNGDLAEVKLGYRLPPSEEEFFKLYSWPVRYDFTAKTPQVFTRIMAKQLYPLFKHELETIGYCFVEE